MHSKVEFVSRVIHLSEKANRGANVQEELSSASASSATQPQQNTTTKLYAWIDFTSYSLFAENGKYALQYLQEITNSPDIHHTQNEQIIIPGCWYKLQKEQTEKGNMEWILNHVHWRYCGGFFVGESKSILKFWEIYQKYFLSFLRESGVLTWEVNFWAWLESGIPEEENWKPIWYRGDHNDSMIDFTSDICYRILQKDSGGFIKTEYDYPNVGDSYRPMSASYLYHEGQHWLNTRFVNYWICQGGGYYYPDGVRIIRTKNVLSKLEMRDGAGSGSIFKSPESFLEMREELPEMKTREGFTQGIEDIKIFKNNKGEIQFIGSTLGYSSCDKIRTIIGNYGLETGMLTDAKIIEPPTDTWCEKNWAPICGGGNGDRDGASEDQDQWFIYKWCPMQIGKCLGEMGEDGVLRYRLSIEKTHETSKLLFGKLRGSTTFVSGRVGETEGLLGVVHYSEETSPRHYYHRLILLDRETYRPIKITGSFCFCGVGVEFCLGFVNSGGKYVFWISQMDRDPLMIEVEEGDVGNWKDIF
jgi:hypothetical protein